MISQIISSNPLVNADRYVVAELSLKPTESIISGYVEYRDTQGAWIPATVRKHFLFSTDGNMVDMTTGEPAQMVLVAEPVLDANGDPTYDENSVAITVSNPQRPTTAIPEITFLQNIPMSVFAQAPTLWSAVASLTHARILTLDTQGKFDE